MPVINPPRFITLLKAIIFWVAFVLLLYISGALQGFFPKSWERSLNGITGTFFALLITWIFLKIEKKSLTTIGLVWESKTILRLFKGLLLGTVLFSLILLSLLCFSELTIEKNKLPFNSWAVYSYLSIIPLAFMEEIAFRSYPFIKLNKVFGLRVTQIIVAIAFALYHIVIGWNLQSAFLGPAIWSLVFGLSAIWSGGIAVPTGIHVALNFLQVFTGTRGDVNSFWVLKFKTGSVENAMAKTDMIGLACQVAILIGALLLTEFFIRKIQKKEL